MIQKVFIFCGLFNKMLKPWIYFSYKYTWAKESWKNIFSDSGSGI